MVLFASLLVVVGFLIFLKVFKVVEKSSEVFGVTKTALAVVNNRDLNDLQKEKMMQAHAKSLFILFFFVTVGSFLSLALPFGLVWLLELMGLVSVDAVIAMTLSWQFIVATIVITVIYFILMKKR